jgi:hypothetical protein
MTPCSLLGSSSVSDEPAVSIFRSRSTLSMNAVSSAGKLVDTYKSTWCHEPEDYNLNEL